MKITEITNEKYDEKMFLVIILGTIEAVINKKITMNEINSILPVGMRKKYKFNKKSDCIYFERISFDGFGCYEIDSRENLLSKEENKILKKEIYSKEMNNEIVKVLAIKLIYESN